MDSAWIGVVGAAVGGGAAFFGQWAVQGRVSASKLRGERRDAYVDFVTFCNRGIRVAQEVRKAADEIDARDALSAPPDELTVRRWSAETKTNKAAVNEFLDEMDRALVRMQLAAPVPLLVAGRLLRESVDELASGELTYEQVENRYGRFVVLARLDLQRSRQIGLPFVTKKLPQADPSEGPLRGAILEVSPQDQAGAAEGTTDELRPIEDA